MIRFQGLTKRYGPLTAVRNLTLEVLPGEVYALLGPNGAGKTTALRCLATLLRPTEGSASVSGADSALHPLEVRRRIAFLAASMGLYERLTSREVVEYFGRLHGMEKDLLESRVEELIELFGITEFANRLCGRLSTGQPGEGRDGIVRSPGGYEGFKPSLGIVVSVLQPIQGGPAQGLAPLIPPSTNTIQPSGVAFSSPGLQGLDGTHQDLTGIHGGWAAFLLSGVETLVEVLPRQTGHEDKS